MRLASLREAQGLDVKAFPFRSIRDTCRVITRSGRVAVRITYPKGPCTQIIVYTLTLK